MKRCLKTILSIMLLATIGLSSCAPLKPYQRVYVNDPEMQMGMISGKGFEKYVQSIREGATDAGASKGDGGCGCN